MSEKFFIGRDIVSFSNNGKFKPISRVTLLLDDENSLTAGDDTGMELVASCRYGTQAMVETLLAQLAGYEYHAFEAGEAGIDPAVELGDGVTVNGIYSMIAQISDDGDGYPSLSAPGKAEMEDEFPADGPKTREFNRKIAQTRSLITKTAEEIRQEVTGLSGQVSSLSTTVQGFDARITAADGKAAKAALRLDGFTVTTYDEDGNVGTVTLKGGTVGSDQIKANVSITAPSIIGGTVYGSTFIVQTPWYSDPTSLDGSAIHIVPEGQSSPFGSIYYRRITSPGEGESAHNLYITTREWRGIASTEPTGSIKIRSGYRMSLEAQVAIYMNGGTQGIVYDGIVDFSKATVTGLTSTAAVAVFG